MHRIKYHATRVSSTELQMFKKGGWGGMKSYMSKNPPGAKKEKEFSLVLITFSFMNSW